MENTMMEITTESRPPPVMSTPYIWASAKEKTFKGLTMLEGTILTIVSFREIVIS